MQRLSLWRSAARSELVKDCREKHTGDAPEIKKGGEAAQFSPNCGTVQGGPQRAAAPPSLRGRRWFPLSPLD